MAPNYGPKIVKDGLVLCLDAANPRSYPGSGTTWSDLSGNGYDGTLVNGPLYSADNKGSLIFDGIDDYSTINEIGQLTRFTVNSWFKPTSYPNDYASIITSVYTNGLVNFKIGYELGSQMFGGFFDGSWRLTPGVNTTLNTWQLVSFSYDGTNFQIYSNGISGGSNTYVGTPNSGGSGIRIGRRWDLADYFIGNISQTSVYNRALLSAEIQQNFNALKGRYGL
jgi:hypothetical protein